MNSLTGLERMGIKMIKDTEKMDRDHMRKVLERAGEGELRRLTPEQVKRMRGIKVHATLLSAFIGFFWTIAPCLIENGLVAWDHIAVDGAKDRFDICQPYTNINRDVNYTAGEEPYMNVRTHLATIWISIKLRNG